MVVCCYSVSIRMCKHNTLTHSLTHSGFGFGVLAYLLACLPPFRLVRAFIHSFVQGELALYMPHAISFKENLDRGWHSSRITNPQPETT